MTRWRVVLCFALVVPISGCLIGSDLVRDDVKGNYQIWAMEAKDQTQFIRADDGSPWPGTTIVGPTVVKAGWDDQFVLLEQSSWSFAAKPKQSKLQRQFYIFDLAKEKLFGPYNRQLLVQQRSRLKVSPTLDLNRVYSTD